MLEKICLIIPCFNEARRLDLRQFLGAKSNISFLFVDDGSKDATSAVIENFRSSLDEKERFYLLNLKRNQGKGEAVRQGMLFALSMNKKFDWIGFWDADLAVPLQEVEDFLGFAHLGTIRPKAIFGSRLYRLGSKIDRKLHRHLLARVFATHLKAIFNLGAYDTQCGAKIFRPEVVENAFAEPFISKWIFDVEIILRLKESCIVEYSVSNWSDVAGSKLKFFSSTLRIIVDVLRIRRKYQRLQSPVGIQ